MAPKNSIPATSTPIDVIGSDALGLAAAYQGIYHLFGGRVSGWEVIDGVLVARGFTVDAQYPVETILTDINRKSRRAQLWPTINWVLDPNFVPDEFESNLAVTTFMVQYFKGSTGEDNSKSAEYVRKAAAAYKVRTGTQVRRGPKPKSIQLKNLKDFNPENLIAAGVSREDMLHLVDVANQALAATPETVQEEVTA